MPGYEPVRGRGGRILPVDEDFPGDHAAYLSDRLTGIGGPVPGESELEDRILDATVGNTALRVVGIVVGTLMLVLAFIGVFR